MMRSMKNIPRINTLTTLDRKSCIPIVDMSRPSILIVPLTGSTKRMILIARVDLPLPVRPNIPIRSFALAVKEIPRMIVGKSGAYLITRS